MTLSEHMKNRGLLDKQVAHELGTSRAFVTELRGRTKQPSLDLAVRIIEWSGGAITPAELLKAPV